MTNPSRFPKTSISVAADAGRQCAPAAPSGAVTRPLNFTVRPGPSYANYLSVDVISIVAD